MIFFSVFFFLVFLLSRVRGTCKTFNETTASFHVINTARRALRRCRGPNTLRVLLYIYLYYIDTKDGEIYKCVRERETRQGMVEKLTAACGGLLLLPLYIIRI